MEESKQLLIMVTELQANMKNLTLKVEEINQNSRLVQQTNESVKSAHNRIDDLKNDFAEKLADEKREREKLEGHINWLWRTVGTGLISFLFGVLLYFIK